MPFFTRWFRPRVVVLELHGILATRPGALSLKSVGPTIDRAFRAAAGKTLLLDIDCRGGSPVQSELIGNLIRRKAADSGTKVHALIGEVGASGGYWLACAADDIRASAMSIVGSIGVVGGGFGFDTLLERIGVQRRLYTAGRNKARLDPFSPERPDDLIFINRLMADIHERFKTWVRTRRTGRLKAEEDDLFDGSFFLGDQALANGLIDGLDDLDGRVKALGGDRARAKVYRPRLRRGLLARLPRLVIEALFDALESRVGF